MTANHLRQSFGFPDYESWWSSTHEVTESSIDEFGHMSAVHYPAIFELASSRFVAHVVGAPHPDYVIAEINVVYRHEVVLDRSPVRVYVRPTLVGATTFSMRLVLADSDGRPCAQADLRYVAWDRAARAKRVMDVGERGAVQRYLDAAG